MINRKVRRVIKYLMNILAIINAALIGLSPIWGWNIGQIIDTIAVAVAVLGLILLEQGIYKAYKKKKEDKA